MSSSDGYRALRRGCALVQRRERDLLEVAGEDRERFLNGLVTCQVKDLASGEGRYGFFTDIRGKILADVLVLAFPDRYRLELPGGRGPAIEDHLRTYLVADRVRLEPVTDAAVLLLAGPRAAEVVSGLTGSLPEPAWAHRTVELEGGEARLYADAGWRFPAFGLQLDAARAASLVRRVAAGGIAGARPAVTEDLETARVEDGVPLFGREFDDGVFPQESGREAEAVSYEKGCYLGQEVVARIHYRGKVNRVVSGLAFGGDAPPELGAALTFEGREVGRVTSAVASPRVGGSVGLGLLHCRAAEPGTRLDLPSGGTARVVELPFAPA